MTLRPMARRHGATALLTAIDAPLVQQHQLLVPVGTTTRAVESSRAASYTFESTSKNELK